MTAHETPNTERWMARRNCWDADPEVFFADESTGMKRKGHVKNAEAKDICGGCDVRLDCLTYAIENGEDWGVWGGLDEDQRRALKAGAA